MILILLAALLGISSLILVVFSHRWFQCGRQDASAVALAVAIVCALTGLIVGGLH